MHILITDSGVGGLSVVAYAERYVRLHGYDVPVRLTFANAAPENDYGYNSMKTRGEKIETFDRFLHNVTERFSPDSIYVACNTLSVLLPDTPYFQSGPVPTTGIVTTAVELLLRELRADPKSVAIIFGTQTTIDAATYPRLLQEAGIDPSRIVSQACPRLADTISEDREGAKARHEIACWVNTAIEKMTHKNAPVVACLACTHYGYRKNDFAVAFQESGLVAKVVNPNESAVDDLFGLDAEERAAGTHHEVDVRFVTRYAIPQVTVETLAWFLNDISPKTVSAMQNFTHLPDLF
jgi:glutamate racemase